MLEEISPEHTARQVDFALDVLGVRAGDRLLDVACGIGRHSIPFAAAGLAVVGLDISPAYLPKAAEAGRAYGAEFVLGDMRHLPIKADTFDAAVSLFTSFGYTADDSDDQRTFCEVGRVLRPGGRFLIDTMHRDALVRRFQERDWTEIRQGVLLERRRWDARRGRIEAEWICLRGQGIEKYPVSIRIYTCSELETMLARAGLVIHKVWGSVDGEPLTMDSWRMLILAGKTLS